MMEYRRWIRHQYPKDRATVHVRERQVDPVRGGIDCDRMRLRGAIPAELHEKAVSLLEHRHDSGLGSYVQPFEFWIERQDVRIAPNRQHLTELQGPQIQHPQRPALLTRDEGHAVRGV